ncbi:unnamed protein product, partial [Urochloa humidicola]
HTHTHTHISPAGDGASARASPSPDLAGVAPDACRAHGAVASSYGFHSYLFLRRRQNRLVHRARIRLAPLGEPPPPRLSGGAILTSGLLLIATLRLCHSLALHLFADMRNLPASPTHPTCSLDTTPPRWGPGPHPLSLQQFREDPNLLRESSHVQAGSFKHCSASYVSA